jgi:hypothetical protein
MSERSDQVKCPEYGSTRVYRDGIRHTPRGDIQRYLCENVLTGARASRKFSALKVCDRYYFSLKIMAVGW